MNFSTCNWSHFISDVLKVFQTQKGEFACSAIQIEEEIKSILNLLRASLIAFPGEKVMEEAQIFATTYLIEALQKIQVSSLSREVRQTVKPLNSHNIYFVL